MSHRNLVILTKIVLFYSLFYVLLKAMVLIFGNAWLLPNLLLMLPYLLLGAIGWWQVKKENYSWLFVAAGAAVSFSLASMRRSSPCGCSRWLPDRQ